MSLNSVKELQDFVLKVSEDLSVLQLEIDKAVWKAGLGWRNEVYEKFVEDINIHQQMLKYLSKWYKYIAEVKLHHAVEVARRFEELDNYKK